MRIKGSYLNKLLLSILGFIAIPLALYLYFMLAQSYKEVESNSIESYQKTTDYIASYVSNEVTRMRTQAQTFAAQSRLTNKSIPNYDILRSNPYYFKRITEMIQNQSLLVDYDLLLYYKDLNSVFTSQNKYTRDEYVSLVSDGRDDVAMLINGFLDSNSREQIYYASIFQHRPLRQAVFYIGIPIKFGVDYRDALLVYMLHYDSIDIKAITTLKMVQLQLMLFDTNKNLLFTDGVYDDALMYASGWPDRTDTAGTHEFQYENEDYAVFFSGLPELSPQCVMLLHGDYVHEKTRSFYYFACILSYCMFAMVLVFTGIHIYSIYLPIRKLSRSVGAYSYRDNEIDIIEGEFSRMRDEIEEKNILITESLISNLLYGAKVSKDLFKYSPWLNSAGDFCVFILRQIKLDAVGRARVLEMLKHTCGTDGFVTDMLYEDYTVLICKLGSEISSVENQLTIYLSDNSDTGSFCVITGIPVQSINDIQKSYESCLNKMKASAAYEKSVSERENLKKQLCSDVVSYISNNIALQSLSQTVVADHFSISTYSLSRLFKEQMGIGFTEYINGKRLDEAKRYLLTTTMKIADIAQATGFSDAKYFSRLFKAHMGVTPNEYRNDTGTDEI